MTLRRSIMTATLLALLSAATVCRAQGGGDWDKVFGNFVVVWSNGDVTAGKKFANWRVSREEMDTFLARKTGQEGMSVLDARFADQPMFSDTSRFARILRNTNQMPKLIGPFVELSGGDILPGALVEGPVKRRDKNGQNPAMFVTVVAGAQFTRGHMPGQVPVRADSVVRVSLTDNARRNLSPGLIVYRDGRELMATSVRWEIDGISILAADSVAKATWAELAEVHFPKPAAVDRVTTDPTRLFCRLVTTNGAILTYPLDTSLRLLQSSHRNKHDIRPLWAHRELRIPLALTASHSFFRADEIPLSRLPATTLNQQNITGYTWRWRRNQNVRGGQLAAGKMVTDVGIGMHSHCEVAFELPDGAISFAAWVGIDEAVGSGGCVRCKVYLDEVAGQPAWSSELLRGSDAPVGVTVGDLRDAKRLILVAECADEDHPPDADPFDLRDEVAWILPFITLDHTSQ